MEGHTGRVFSVDMDRNCRSAGSGSDDETVKLWDLGSGRCSATLEDGPGLVRDVVMHESGRSFLSSGQFTAKAWSVGSSMRADLKMFFPRGKWASRLFASRDLSRVACCAWDITAMKLEMRLWR